MYYGLIRPSETRTEEREGNDLSAVRRMLTEATPAGFELTKVMTKMAAGKAELTAVGTYRSTETHEIEADDRAALDAKVPEGWMLLSVRKV